VCRSRTIKSEIYQWRAVNTPLLIPGASRSQALHPFGCCLSNSCRKVEPLRGIPVMKMGRSMTEASRSSNRSLHARANRNRVSSSSCK
jgi:hypothetical protein